MNEYCWVALPCSLSHHQSMIATESRSQSTPSFWQLLSALHGQVHPSLRCPIHFSRSYWRAWSWTILCWGLWTLSPSGFVPAIQCWRLFHLQAFKPAPCWLHFCSFSGSNSSHLLPEACEPQFICESCPCQYKLMIGPGLSIQTACTPSPAHLPSITSQ